MSELEDLEDKEQYLETITVQSLINILLKYPKHMKVMTTWESTVHTLQGKNVYEALTGTLYIDADENFYKKRYAKNPKENEEG